MPKPRKYEEIIKLLPMQQEEPRSQEKIDEEKAQLLSLEERFVGLVPDFKRALLGKTTVDIGRLYLQAREHKDMLEEALSTTNRMIAALVQLGALSFQHEGVTSVKIEGYGPVSYQPEPVASIVDHPAFINWVKENGYENSLTLYSATVTSIVKNRLLEGLGEPDGVKAYYRPKLVKR